MTKRLWLAAVLFAALALALHIYALWSRQFVPLYDLPNHMARHSAESAHWSGEEFAPFYDVHYRVLPNLGGDLTIPLLLQICDPLTACRLFLTISVLVFWLGPTLFILQAGGLRPSAIFASLLWLPFLFNSQFFWGFINYYSGFGLAFLVLAHFNWIWSRQKFSAAHAVIHIALVALLFLWHLAPWGIYGVIMGCRVLADSVVAYRQQRSLRILARASAYLALSAPSLVLFAVYFVSREGTDPTLAYNWGGVARKLLMPVTLFRTYEFSIDAATALAWFAAIVLCFRFRLLLEYRNGWIVLSLAALCFLYVVIPFQLGSTSDTDSRLLPAILVCVLASLSRISIHRLALGIALLGLCILLRAGGVVVAWNRINDRLDDQVNAISRLDEGSRIFPILLLPDHTKEYPEGHFVMWSVVLKRTFVPTLFVYPDQQPISFRRPYRRCAKLNVRKVKPGVYAIDEDRLRSCYDYVWIFNPQQHVVRTPASCEVVYARGATTLLRVRASSK